MTHQCKVNTLLILSQFYNLHNSNSEELSISHSRKSGNGREKFEPAGIQINTRRILNIIDISTPSDVTIIGHLEWSEPHMHRSQIVFTFTLKY